MAASPRAEAGTDAGAEPADEALAPLAISLGDPAGIGPEIVAASWPAWRGRAVVVGDADRLAEACRLRGVSAPVVCVAAPAEALACADALPVIQSGPSLAGLAWGQVDARAGEAAYRWVQAAARLALGGEAAGLVTAPIHKGALAAAGVPFPGHTEILQHLCGGAPVAMMLANDELRTVLVTIHQRLRDAIDALDVAAELRAIRFADAAMRDLGIAAPRVAVAGVNPHAGEGGRFGPEEGEIVAPAIAAARAEGIDASGPWPGDTVFMQARAGRFDVVVAQYHDQGLIPVKYLGLEHGVNVTLGLPFVRTSPDHGTAFDLAGRGTAREQAFATAFSWAERAVAGRAGYGGGARRPRAASRG